MESAVMKRIIVFVCVAFALLCIFGCSAKESEPENVSSKMYEIGIAALETVDEYLDYNIDIAETYDRISASSRAAANQYEKDKEEIGEETLTGSEFANDYFINHNILMLSYELMTKKHGTGTNKEIVEKRNDLAEWLGEKTRE